jgi:alpha-tubulin suppressor-like RCC1 family protein
VEGLKGVRVIAAAEAHSLAVTQSGEVFSWGYALLNALRPIIVEGFGGVRVRSVCAGHCVVFAMGEAGELFSWGIGQHGHLGHGDRHYQPSPKRVLAESGVRVCSVSVAWCHVLALAEDGLVYAWGKNVERAVLSNPHVERELLPKPVEALRGVRVGGITACRYRSYAVMDTGELWAWGWDAWGGNLARHRHTTPLGHGKGTGLHLPKPIESLRGIKVDAVAAGPEHTLALADDGSVFVWGDEWVVLGGAFGLCSSDHDEGTPRRVPALRVACGL